MRIGWLVVAVATVVAVPASGHATGLPCRPDAQLGDAASALLLESARPTGGQVLAALREAGSDLPFAHALKLPRSDAQKLADWLAALRARSDAPLVCGKATEDGVQMMLAAPRGGSLQPVGDAVRVHLADGFGDPYLALRDAAGTYRRLPVDVGALHPVVTVPHDLRRPVTVQLVATGRAGPRPVAVCQVGAPGGAADPADPASGVMVPPPGPLAVRLAELRAHDGASSLRPNRLMDEVAFEHARDVCASGRVVHDLAPGADPQRRLAQRGLRARVVGEVVARARDAEGAFDALADSPSHRLTMVDRRFTDVGLGTAHDPEGRTCVVLLFAAWPRFFGG